MRERVVITGIGCISSFGVGHAAFADALLARRSGLVPITDFDTSACRSHRAALIQDFDPTVFISPLKLRRVDAVGRLALVCAQLTFNDARWTPGPQGTDDVGVALGTYTAGLDSTVEYLRGFTRNGGAGVPALLFSNTVSNAPASLCAIEWGLRGPNVTFNQREASSLAALVYAVGAVRDRRVRAILSGGVDRIEETFFKVQDRFHAMSPRRSGGDEIARPFDRRRNGFVLGEGGFTCLVEASSSAIQRGAPIYGEILGVGASSSNTTINGWPRDAAGPARAMRLALEDAGLGPDGIDVVFASANGSPELDAIEASAIALTFGDRRVAVTSIKGAIGESGPAGAGGMIAGLLCLGSGLVPPAAGFAEPDPALHLNVNLAGGQAAGDVFLVNSTASGGANYAIAVRAVNQL